MKKCIIAETSARKQSPKIKQEKNKMIGRMARFMILCSFFIWVSHSPLFAETVILKSGRKVEGRITEKAADYIKIDCEGIVVTYFNDEIKEILGAGGQSSSDEDAVISQVLELSGLKRQIEQLPSLIIMGAAENLGDMDEETFTKFNQAISESFQADKFYQVVFNHLKDNFDQERFIAALKWLESPLSKKMAQLEVESSTPKAMQEMKDFALQLQSHPPAQERLALVQSLDEASGATKLSIDVQIAFFQTMSQALDPIMPPEKRLKPGELEQLIDNMRGELQLSEKDQTLASYLYTYRQASDQELREYINFFESDTGRFLNKVFNTALLKAIETSGDDFGNKMAKILPTSQPAQQENNYSP